MNADYRLIGARIKEQRKQRNLTQDQLAELLDVTVGYVSQVERGATKISLDLLAAISDHLQCEIGYLVAGSAARSETYLTKEFEQQFISLTPKEKQLVIGFIRLLTENR